MAEQLTAQQYEAVHNRGGKLLVSAAAGSGKTKVLVDRLLSYLTDPVNPANMDDFLIITYTKAAAAELRGKIAAKISQAVAENPGNRHLKRQMQRLYLAKISTVHGFCADVLKEQAYRLDVPGDFRVADENECIQLQMRAMEQILECAYETAEENAEFRAFIDTQGLGRDDRQIPEIILQVYQSARCHLDPNGWLAWCEKTWNVDEISDAGQTIWGQYLMADLRSFLALHIDALNTCIAHTVGVVGMEKAAALLETTVSQLKALQSAATWDEIIALRNVDFGRLSFPKNCADTDLAERIKAVRNACKEGLNKKLRGFSGDSEQILSDLEESAEAARGLIKLVRAFDEAYDKLKRSHRILDFADLEHKTLDLLLGRNRSGATAVARELGARYREVMVDEYQDSNQVQDAIFSALTEEKQNCFMVGDVKQSIYQFRLADPEIFIDKYNSYLPAGEAKQGQGRKVLLSSNFRSSGGVIEGVNDVFSLCMSHKVGGLEYGEEEQLNEGIPHADLGEPEVALYGIEVQEDTYAEESQFVANKIAQMLDGNHMVRDGENLRPVKPEDIVILLRSPGSVGGEFRYALEQKGIPCTTGDSADLLQSEEIAIVHSLLQVISNPLQEIPLIAVMTSPLFCFTADELALIRSKNRRCNLYELLQQEDNKKVITFLKTLNDLRKDSKRRRLTQLLERIIFTTNIDIYCSAKTDGDIRQENLQVFCQIAANFESTGHKDLEQFLQYLDAMSERGLTAQKDSKQENAVTIMSIHKSKGLEFPVVFLCALSREFNRESLYRQVLCHKDLGLGLNCVDKKQRVRYPTVAKRAIAAQMAEQSVSEELRVLYVAMTRARDRLIMTYAAKSLSGHLEELALRKDISQSVLLSSEADCPGTWVLLTALERTEAGAFFELCNCYPATKPHSTLWKIGLADCKADGDYQPEEEAQPQICPEKLERMREALAYSYPHRAATAVPSKQTATQLKGRVKDQEAVENAQPPVAQRVFSGLNRDGRKSSGICYGNAVHAILQHIHYECCDTVEHIANEVNRLVTAGFITQEQAQLADCEKIAAFFATDIGVKLRSGCQVLREFKFSVLEDAAVFYPGLEGEKILLQGVVDCALVEDDGLTVVDFKTDYATEETLPMLTERYRPQVSAYASALSRIYQLPVKKSMLYFFSLGRFVSM